MAKILLVNPPFYRLLGSHYNANSLGIAYIAAFLNDNGHTAFLYNADYLDDKEYANLSTLYDNFSDYEQYFNNPDAFAIWDEVVQKILEFEPEWVGYTSYTANISAIDIISQRVRSATPRIRQVIGGTHATLDKQVLAKLPAIDFSVSREGEAVMLDLVSGKSPASIKGVASRGPSGKIIHNGDAEVLDVDSLPFPDREHFWGLSPEQSAGVDVSYVVTIRGCPYRCNYCASRIHGREAKLSLEVLSRS